MKRLLFSFLTIGLLIAAAAFSNRPSPPSDDLRVKVEDRNPWTHLRLNNDPDEFHIAIVSDRTGPRSSRGPWSN